MTLALTLLALLVLVTSMQLLAHYYFTSRTILNTFETFLRANGEISHKGAEVVCNVIHEHHSIVMRTLGDISQKQDAFATEPLKQDVDSQATETFKQAHKKPWSAVHRRNHAEAMKAAAEKRKREKKRKAPSRTAKTTPPDEVQGTSDKQP